ncbi:M28 family peptidase [Spirillospora sp. NBC_01491]|uniref:M28 family peptidase n=1 Tax=Spirillospora sp. NBC_01491 TaxID=2976007 RepID=UPI002E31BD91|nr:M28 family peptidase [Spirillospora sp. NBC_01491]
MRSLAIVAAVTVSAWSITGTAFAVPGPFRPAPVDLPRLVTLKDIRAHLAAFEEIARYNGGDRAAGEPGDAVTVKYVVARLKAAGFTPRVQRFAFDAWTERSKPVLARTAPGRRAYRASKDFSTLTFSAAGDVTARAVAVDVPARGAGTSGCEASDFARFPKGAVALMQRGTCTFEAKADRAKAAGARAVVIYNRPGEKGPVAGTLNTPFELPAVAPTHRLGLGLVAAARRGGLRLRVRTDTRTSRKRTANVIAETGAGRADNVVLAGAHLDSVPAGPGINDNGTGAAALLAVAGKIAALGRAGLRNKVRFAWWGAEEEGLRGSSHYVGALSAADRARIALNLNFDMLGSVNGVRGVYDGDHSVKGGSTPPPGSGAIEKIFRDYYARRGLPTVDSEFNGRSDYGPFIEHGIPAGGMDTGADGIKTAALAKRFGGTAGKAFDPCYHSRCDTLKNVDFRLLDTGADGVAHAVQRLAGSTLVVNGAGANEAARRAGVRAGAGAGAGAEWRGGLLVR